MNLDGGHTPTLPMATVHKQHTRGLRSGSDLIFANSHPVSLVTVALEQSSSSRRPVSHTLHDSLGISFPLWDSNIVRTRKQADRKRDLEQCCPGMTAFVLCRAYSYMTGSDRDMDHGGVESSNTCPRRETGVGVSIIVRFRRGDFANAFLDLTHAQHIHVSSPELLRAGNQHPWNALTCCSVLPPERPCGPHRQVHSIIPRAVGKNQSGAMYTSIALCS